MSVITNLYVMYWCAVIFVSFVMFETDVVKKRTGTALVERKSQLEKHREFKRLLLLLLLILLLQQLQLLLVLLLLPPHSDSESQVCCCVWPNSLSAYVQAIQWCSIYTVHTLCWLISSSHLLNKSNNNNTIPLDYFHYTLMMNEEKKEHNCSYSK